MPEFEYDDIIAEYDVLATLGEGGQKIVFAVDHPQYGLCVLKIGVFQSQIALERIRREVETLKSISSDYYPEQFEFNVVGGNRFCILEERIAGQPLSAQIGEFSSVSAATRLVLGIIDGLMVLW